MLFAAAHFSHAIANCAWGANLFQHFSDWRSHNEYTIMNDNQPSSKIEWEEKSITTKRRFYSGLGFYLIVLGTLVSTLIITHLWIYGEIK